MTNSSTDDTAERTDASAHPHPRRRGTARLLVGVAVVVALVLGLGSVRWCPVVAGAVFTNGANIPQLYGRRVIALERHALATATGRWRLIVLSWMLSPLVWIAYSAVTVLALIPAILGG